MCYYRTDDGKCKKYTDDRYVSHCVDGPCPDDTPTNGDRIRSATDEELAVLICEYFECADCPAYDIPDRRTHEAKTVYHNSCAEVNLVYWLKQPLKTEVTP